MLVHTNMRHIRRDQPVNIILTPQFYTIKKEALPVKYAYQAKKIAPSLFDGLLDESGNYDYFVFKEEETEEKPWVFIAYDIDAITSFLSDKGFTLNKISKIFFAQQSLKHFSKAPLALDEQDTLTVIEDTVVVVPRIALGEETAIFSHFSNAFTPETSGIKPKPSPSQESDLLSRTQALSLAAIFTLFAGMFVVEGSRYDSDSESQSLELNTLYEKHSYLQSSYTRDAAVEKYKTLDTKERLKRDTIKVCSKMIFKGIILTKLTTDDTHVVCTFESKNSKDARQLKTLAKKSTNISFSIKGDSIITLEAKL